MYLSKIIVQIIIEGCREREEENHEKEGDEKY